MQQHTPHSFQYSRDESVSFSIRFSFASACSPITEMPDEYEKDPSFRRVHQSSHLSPSLLVSKSPVACSTPTVNAAAVSSSVFDFADVELQHSCCKLNATIRTTIGSYSDGDDDNDDESHSGLSDHSSDLSDDLFDMVDSSRQRGVGVSDDSHFKTPRNRMIYKSRPSIPSSVFSRRFSGKPNVLSSSFTPSFKRTRRDSPVVRVSGVALSPTSVSWNAISPLPFPLHDDGIRSSVTSGNIRLLDSVDQCPNGKLFLWKETESLLQQKQLGRGGFGSVFEGEYRGHKVAVKKLENEWKHRNAVLEILKGETIAMRFNHANIIRTICIMHYQPSTYFVIMEFSGGTSLSEIINSDETITERRIYKFSRDILCGLSYLHDEVGVLHLDIKPSNVIVECDDKCKICDFGSCTPIVSPAKESIQEEEKNTHSCRSSVPDSGRFTFNSAHSGSSKASSSLLGTFIYRAPELLRGNLPTTKSDIFSFSVTAWQIWSRETPYSGQHNQAAVFAVVAYGARPRIPSFANHSPGQSDKSLREFFELLEKCWSADPDERPSASDALQVIEWKLDNHGY